MPSLLSRLRKRTISPVLSHSEVSVSPQTPPHASPHALPFVTPPALLSSIDRNIISSPCATHEEHPKEALTGLRPRPSTRKSSSDPPRRSLDQFIPEASLKFEAQSPGTLISISPNAKAGKSSNRILDRLSDLDEWSTFGRQKDYTRSLLGDFGDESPSRDISAPDANPRDAAEIRATSIRSPNASDPSSPPYAFRSFSTPSQKSLAFEDSYSPSNTESSEHKSPKTPERRRSLSESFFATLSSRGLGFGSPRTFGYPTPPETRTTGISFREETPPPPMPALDHPGLANNLSSRFREPEIADDDTSRKSSPASRKTRASPASERSMGTRPGRRATIGTGGPFSSLQFTFGKSSRYQSSLPSAQQMFNNMKNLGNNSPSRASPRGTEINKNKHQRRWSAEWNARQATEEFGWPALVSKEILKLSLQNRQVASTATIGKLDPDIQTRVPTRVDNVLNLPSKLPHPRCSHSSASPSHHYSSLRLPILIKGKVLKKIVIQLQNV